MHLATVPNLAFPLTRKILAGLTNHLFRRLNSRIVVKRRKEIIQFRGRRDLDARFQLLKSMYPHDRLTVALANLDK